MKRPLLWAALFLTLGVLILNSRVEDREKWLLRKPSLRMALERSYSGYIPVSLTGKVLWAEEKNGRMVYRLDAGKENGTVLVYESAEHASTEEEAADLVGSSVMVSGTAFLFQASENPGQFDVRGYYENLGIYFGVSEAEVWADSAKAKSLRRVVYQAAAALRKTIRNNASTEDANFLLSLSLGTDSSTTDVLQAQADALSAMQLISLSGFIISSIGMLIYRLLRRLCPDLILCALVSFLVVILYHCLLGSPDSMLRALIILSLRIAAPALRRRFDTLSAASLSVILLGITRPTFLLLPSMQFYSAVLMSQGIICPMVRRSCFRQKLGVTSFLSFSSMQCCLLAVQILTRYSWSPYGMILVWFLLPLKTAAIVFTLLSASLGVLFGCGASEILTVLFRIPALLRMLYSFVLDSFQELPFASVNAGNPPFYRMIMYGTLIFLIPSALAVRSLLIRKQSSDSGKWLSKKTAALIPAYYVLLIVVGAIFLRAPNLDPQKMVYTMLSVGQGDAGIVRTKDLTIGVDAGSSSLDDAGGIYTDALAYYGVRQLDLMTLSHGDQDHVNGLKDILNDPGIQVGEVWIADIQTAETEYTEVLELLSAKGITCRRVGRGDKMRIGSTVIEVLSPEHNAALQGNDGSLVLLISHGADSILFTGDISSEIEGKLFLPLSRPDILKTAHHGSRFSSSERFIEDCSPRAALVSYGKNNSYGHPADDTIDRFQKAGIPLYGTGKSGAIEASLCGGSIGLRFYGPGKNANLPLD